MDKGCHSCGLGKPSLLKVAQQPFSPCVWCTDRWELCYHPATPETLIFTAHMRLRKLLVDAAPGEAGQTDSFGETGISLGLWSSTALLQEFTQWRYCAAAALASITNPGGNDPSEEVRRNDVFALLSRLNLIFHAPKGTSSCSETFVAQSWRKLSSAIRLVFSKNTIFFRTS